MDIELKSVLDGISESVKSFKTHIDSVDAKSESIQKQLDALVLEMKKPGGDGGMSTKSLSAVVKSITESASFDMMRKTGNGRAIVTVPNLLEVKAAITSGSLVPYAHDGGIGATGRKRYGLVRQLMRSMPIDTGSAHYVKETAFTDNASPQVEASEKSESTFTFAAATAGVKTIAHWSQASKQVLDDLVELGEHIQSSLIYGLEREFEEQILAGDNTGENLNGLITQASNFDTSLLVASDGWEYADVLGTAALQLEEAGYACNAFVVSPRVWFRILAQKNANGDYIYGNPASERIREILWNCTIVPSPAMSTSSFLAGDFETGAHIRMRQESTIDISDSHSDFFTKNLLAIRAELRAALVVKKPGAFVKGSLTQSPA